MNSFGNSNCSLSYSLFFINLNVEGRNDGRKRGRKEGRKGREGKERRREERSFLFPHVEKIIVNIFWIIFWYNDIAI